MHIPSPFAFLRTARRAWGYFRTGVRVEGAAYLCESDHSPLFSWGEVPERPPEPQHIDVEISMWNTRSDPVTVIDIAEMRILSRAVRLTDASFAPFESVTLEPGAAPKEVAFSLVPADDPGGRVEVSGGEVLRLEFRPSRGSERWARPWLELHLGTRH